MTNKRRDDNRQLQAHELERLEDSPAAEAGTWKKADQSTLAKRRVIKIARRGSSSTTAPSAEAPTKKNPFSSFSGLVSSTQPSKPSTFGSSAPSTTAAPSAVASTGSFTGFGGFNGFQKPIGEASSKTAPASGSFSFGSTKIPVPSSTPNFGSVNLPVPSSTATFPKEGVGLNGGWAPKPLSSTTPPLVALARPPLRSSQNAKRGLEDEPSGFGGGGKGTKTYADQQMEKLNVKFRRWVEQHRTQSKGAAWKAGVEDYIRYAEKLTADREEENMETGGGGVTAQQTPPVYVAATKKPSPFGGGGGGGGGAPQQQQQQASSSEVAKKPLFPPPPSKDTGGAAAAPSFSFGASSIKPASQPPPAAASSSSFSFSAKPVSATEGGSGGMFSFGSKPAISSFNKPPASSTAPSSNAGVDEDELEPEKPEEVLKADDGDEVIRYEVRAKFLKMGVEVDTDGKPTGKKEWKDLGVGALKIMVHKINDKRRLVMRNEKSGKILLNMALYARMAFKQQKQHIHFLGVPEGSDKPTRVSVKVGAADVIEAMKQLADAVPK